MKSLKLIRYELLQALEKAYKIALHSSTPVYIFFDGDAFWITWFPEDATEKDLFVKSFEIDESMKDFIKEQYKSIDEYFEIEFKSQYLHPLANELMSNFSYNRKG